MSKQTAAESCRAFEECMYDLLVETRYIRFKYISLILSLTQLTFTSSKSTKEALEKDPKCVQS